MKIASQTLWLPKAGNTEEEYEDAAFPMEDQQSEVDSFRCAVADGATETSFARQWAQLLVKGYVDQIGIEDLQNSWSNSISSKELPWYAEEKAEIGAFAALVGLTIKQKGKSKKGTWEAEAIGDSCLLHVRGQRILSAFPLARSEEFNSRPFLIPSMPGKANDVLSARRTMEGEWHSGDVFYLLSDAIACWTLRREEEKHDAIACLRKLTTRDALNVFAHEERSKLDEEGRTMMRNDDVTLLAVHVQA